MYRIVSGISNTISTIRNNITRSLNILGRNKIDVSYCLLSNISALLSKSHFNTAKHLQS